MLIRMVLNPQYGKLVMIGWIMPKSPFNNNDYYINVSKANATACSGFICVTTSQKLVRLAAALLGGGNMMV